MFLTRVLFVLIFAAQKMAEGDKGHTKKAKPGTKRRRTSRDVKPGMADDDEAHKKKAKD